MTTLSLAAGLPAFPSPEARTIVGNPTTLATAAGTVFRKSLRFIIVCLRFMN
jgi:hypothetical protein